MEISNVNMKIKYVLLILSGVFLCLAVMWAITQDSRIEPWTVIISGVIAIIGLLIPGKDKAINQKDYFSGGNESEVEGVDEQVNQINWFGFKNKKSVKK